jgi:hypothetical protein
VAHTYADRVKETTSSTGTGDITLAGAASGYQSFNAGIGTSNTTDVCVVDSATGAWEIFVGTLTDATTIGRGDLIASSTGSRVSFVAGAKDVFCTLPASKVLPATAIPFRYTVAVGDETTAVTSGSAKLTFRWPYPNTTLTGIAASLNTASSSGAPTFDVNKAGTSVLSTKLTVDAGEETSVTAATPPVLSDTSLTYDAKITVDIDASGTGAAGPKITFIGTYYE